MSTVLKKRKLANNENNKIHFYKFLEDDLKINNKKLIINIINEIEYNNLTFDNFIDILNNYHILKVKNNFNNNFIIWNFISSKYDSYINNKILGILGKINKKIKILYEKIIYYFNNTDDINLDLKNINSFKNKLNDIINELTILKLKFKKISLLDNKFINETIDFCNKLLNKKENLCILKDIHINKMIELNQKIINFNEELDELLPSFNSISKDIILKIKKKMIYISSNYKKLLFKMKDLLSEELIFNYKESVNLYDDIFKKYIEYKKNLNNMNYMHY
jgi:hypothetical protein